MSGNHSFSFSSANREGLDQKEDNRVHLENLHSLGLLPKKAVGDTHSHSRSKFDAMALRLHHVCIDPFPSLLYLGAYHILSSSPTVVDFKSIGIRLTSFLSFQVARIIPRRPGATRLRHLIEPSQNLTPIDRLPTSR